MYALSDSVVQATYLGTLVNRIIILPSKTRYATFVIHAVQGLDRKEIISRPKTMAKVLVLD